jgi:hypothetical protein
LDGKVEAFVEAITEIANTVRSAITEASGFPKDNRVPRSTLGRLAIDSAVDNYLTPVWGLETLPPSSEPVQFRIRGQITLPLWEAHR